MTEQAFEWRLSLTERRIAEMAFAIEGAWLACKKIKHLRGERGDWDDDFSVVMNAAMLRELRTEPSKAPGGHARGIDRVAQLGGAVDRERRIHDALEQHAQVGGFDR